MKYGDTQNLHDGRILSIRTPVMRKSLRAP